MHLILQAFLNLLGLLGDVFAQRAHKGTPVDVFTGVVRRIVDGDTIEVVPNGGSVAMVVRLLFIDAPESLQVFGKESALFLSEIKGQQVTIAAIGTDVYGRLLGEVTVTDQSVNLGMVRNGWAWALPDAPSDYQAAMEQARAERIGLWRAEEATAPWVFRKIQPAC